MPNDDDIFSLDFEDVVYPKENAKDNQEMFADLQKVIGATEFADWFKDAVSSGKQQPPSPVLKEYPAAKILPNNDINSTALSSGKIQYPELLDCAETDYQAVCIARNVEQTSSKLMAFAAQGKWEEAEKIIPDFKKKYQDKITQNNTCVSMDGKDYDNLRNDIMANFHNAYPSFIRDSQKYYQENSPKGPKSQLNDNQFINLAMTKTYDVTNDDNCKLAAGIHQKYTQLVENLQAREKTPHQQMKTDAENAQALSQKRTAALQTSHQQTGVSKGQNNSTRSNVLTTQNTPLSQTPAATPTSDKQIPLSLLIARNRQRA